MKQIDHVLSQLRFRPEQIKLYNSGSFFDPAAIPPADYPAIARTIVFAKRVVVESHPRLVGEKALRFRDLLSGSLEVAMGLETVHRDPGLLGACGELFEQLFQIRNGFIFGFCYFTRQGVEIDSREGFCPRGGVSACKCIQGRP